MKIGKEVKGLGTLWMEHTTKYYPPCELSGQQQKQENLNYETNVDLLGENTWINTIKNSAKARITSKEIGL